MSTTQKTDSRHVNNLLHTLRGEQFRHSQNVRKSRDHISSTFNHNSPTLPLGLTGPDYSNPDPEPIKIEEFHSTSNRCPGPEPPKSWRLTSRQDIHDTPAWRAQALSIVLTHPQLPGGSNQQSLVPPLTLLCLRILSSFSSVEFIEDIVPFIPPHLRRDLVRATAVHSPLHKSKLFALYEPEGHADSEIIIVGPSAILQEDYFLRNHSGNKVLSSSQHTTEKRELSDWDSDNPTPELLSTFIIVSTRLAVSSLLTLPPTITHMALINLPIPISLHRLPGTCPLLIVLDVSYNTWLSEASKDAPRILDRVEWSRWSRLRTLGARECHISNEVRVKLNKGRWDDVEVIQ